MESLSLINDLAQTGAALWLAIRLQRLLGQLTVRVERIEAKVFPEAEKPIGFDPDAVK